MTFNSSKYDGSKEYLIDVTDDYANKNFVISFYHLISEKTLTFKAYITNFNDTFNSTYVSETVFGRADPIHSFKNTTRQISLAFKAPASSIGEGYENLAKVQLLTQFLYPAYLEDNSALTITQTPLVRLKVMNLLGDSNKMPSQDPTENFRTVYSTYGSNNESTTGLLGVINNVTVLHGLESDASVFIKSDGVVIPKSIEVSINFSPIHQHTVGWNEDREFYQQSFPYGAVIGGEPEDSDKDTDPLSDQKIAKAETEEASPDDATQPASDAVNEAAVALQTRAVQAQTDNQAITEAETSYETTRTALDDEFDSFLSDLAARPGEASR